jgi:lysozyme family protein
MSAANFASSLALVLQHEGGFVDDPQDPGGRTNQGITQTVYDDWRIAERLPKRDVKIINAYEVGTIYRGGYWNPCRCDDLPSGVDYAVFDFAVNSGVQRASRFLQRVASVAEDGVIGPETLRAIGTLYPLAVIDALCDLRLGFLQQLSTFKRFGKGWAARVADVDAKARDMIPARGVGAV